MKRLWQRLRRILAFAFFIGVFLLGAVALLLNTESGSRFALNRIAALAPGTLQFDRVEGTLWRTLRIGSLEFNNEMIDLSSDDLEIVISWPSAFAGRVVLDRLMIGEVAYRNLAPVDRAPSPLEIAMEPLPVTIGIVESRIAVLRLLDEASETLIANVSIDDASMNDARLTVDAASAAFNDVEATITRLDVDLTDQVPISADVAWRYAGGAWSGQGSVTGSLVEAEVEHLLTTPNEVSASGLVRLLNRIEPEFDLQIAWQQWSVANADLTDGNLLIAGTTNDYQTEFQLAVSEPRIPDLVVGGIASGNTQGFSDAEVRLQSASGDAIAAGAVAWLPEPTASLSLRIEDLDPAVIDARLSGLVSGSARFDLAGAGSWRFGDADFTGTLNDAELMLTGNVARADGQLECDLCRIRIGPNVASADGSFGDERIALDLSIDAPDLETIWAALDGRLSVAGRLDGTSEAPRFTGSAAGAGLRYDIWAAEEFQADSRDSGADRIDVTLSVSSLRRADVMLGSFAGDVNGTSDRLDFDLNWTYRDIAVEAIGNFNRRDVGFDGAVTRAALTEPYAGRWVLAAPLTVRQDEIGLEVSAHRWLLPDGQLDVSRLSSTAEELALTASLTDLPLATANTFLPEAYRLAGTADAEVDLMRRAGQWSGSVHWSQADTVLHIAETGDTVFDLQIPEASVDATLAAGGVQIESELSIDPGVSASMRLGMERLSSDSPIEAALRIGGEQWGWVSSLVPAIDNFDGDIAVDLTAVGPLLAPEIGGEATWLDGSVAVPALNVPLNDIDLAVAGGSSGTATLRGSARAGDGTLEITGRFEDLMQDTRRLELDVTGQAAELINWPEYRLWATPDVRIEGTAAGWTLNGSVDVPKAEIAIRELPEGAVGISSDVRTIGEDKATETASRYAGAVMVTLGEDVHVSAFGLDTDLEGELALRKQANQEQIAEGRVNLVDGVFVAYGQRLTIQEGTLTFTGPLDDPLVDVRAIRTIDEFDQTITAGIHVRGRARNLNSTVFSEPAMGEADALSYLIIGRPLAEASNAEGGQLSNAAVGLGLRQASRITQQIGQSLGLDQLAISGDGGDGTALVAGKQISSRLYARYAYGVFSRLGMIMLRYRLSDHFSLEAGAGENQSIDILYSVEKE